MEEYRYGSTFWTSAINWSGQLHASASLHPGKEPSVSPHRRLGGPQSLFEHCGVDKNLALAGIRTPMVEPVSRHYLSYRPAKLPWMNMK
jgi:hypothetical protein